MIPNLFEMGYRIFPSKDTAPDHCLWTMLNGAFGKPIQAALRAQAVQLIKEFETVGEDNPIIEMADSIENTALVHPVHFVIQKGRVGLESGLARAFAKAFQEGLSVLGYQRDERGGGRFLLGSWTETGY